MTTSVERLTRATEIIGLPVVTIDGGEDVAEIRDVAFDGATHRLVGFTLNKRGWFRGRLPEQLPAIAIEAIGPHAVMIADEQALAGPGGVDAALDGDAESHVVIGTGVMAADGTELGTVAGVVVSTSANPAAVGYEITTEDGQLFVPISAELALSDSFLLLPASATDFVRNDLTGFGAAVDDYRAALKADPATAKTEGNRQ